jgi:DNA-binding response OmpR family regulator
MGKILVVNNDIDTMELLKSWFERKNFDVKYTSDADEVPDLVKQFYPDVVLVDVLQSKAAEQLKSDRLTKQIPVILMTGYTTSKQVTKETTIDDVIEKPFDLKLLEKKIERFLKSTG